MSKLSATVYGFAVVVLTVYGFLHAKNNWDLLPYEGTILSWHTTDADTIHREAYASVRRLHEYPVLAGTKPVLPFQQDIARDSNHFAQQLPFYSVKPLYCLLVAALHRVGFSFPSSLAVVSSGSYLVLCVLTWVWLRRYLSSWLSLAFALLLVISRTIYTTAKIATPDALALVLVAVALYLLLETSHAIVASTLLLLTVWVRSDSLILTGLVLYVAWQLKKIDTTEFGTFGAVAVLSYLAIRRFAGPYPWSVLFYNSFITPLTAPGEAVVHVSWRTYAAIVTHNARILTKSTSFMLLIMGVLALFLHRLRSYRLVIAAVLMYEVLHFVLYPSAEERFYTLSTYFIPISLFVLLSSYRRVPLSFEQREPAHSSRRTPFSSLTRVESHT